MFNSETFGIPIARPLAEVYEFLLEPSNIMHWAVVGGTETQHLGGRFWSAETSVGPRIIRFAERNDFGILDHHIFRHPGDTPHLIGARVVPNGAGTELIYTSFQRPEASEFEWQSLKEWITADLLAMQSMLEARGRVAPMAPARTVSLSIERPVPEVFDFVIDPANLPKWGFEAAASRLTDYEDNQWLVETAVGPRVMQFSKRNNLGVLDAWSRRMIGGAPVLIPIRVFPNDEGTELTYTFLQRPGTTKEAWHSLQEWMATDLFALKNTLEFEVD
ncbi:MAG TPA: hypothetical protein VL418_02065 [Devosiaceae bacterium]|jgi:uncharacterized protein YndB with AHSA1/START domain|nr:hypothetical protein [Devosiaceae bacterium]